MVKTIAKTKKEKELIEEYYSDIDIDEVRKEFLEDYKITPEDLDFEFDERTILFKYQENTKYFYMFNDIYQKEKSVLVQLMDNYKKLLGVKYDNYRFNSEKDLKKTEIENYYLPKDEDVIAMGILIKKQEIRVNFIELICKTFEKQQWNMKSYKEILYNK